jgi:mannose/fructose/N-acetylgalactosamine-specific phosphotransferase system component IID
MGAKKLVAHCSPFNHHLNHFTTAPEHTPPLKSLYQKMKERKFKKQEVGFYETSPKIHSLWTSGHVMLVMETHEMRKNKIAKVPKKSF